MIKETPNQTHTSSQAFSEKKWRGLKIIAAVIGQKETIMMIICFSDF